MRHRQEGTWPGQENWKELAQLGACGGCWDFLLLWSYAGTTVFISVTCAGFRLDALLCCIEVLCTEKHQDAKCKAVKFSSPNLRLGRQ